MEEKPKQEQRTEIIAFCSGKGGTGKTLMASCFGFALRRAGHKVLMIDADPATDGMSLFLLGPRGTKDIESFDPLNTFAGALQNFKQTGSMAFEPRVVHREAADDHGLDYTALISGKGLYGDQPLLTTNSPVPDLDQSVFRVGLRQLFDALRTANEYTYVLVDTRGGFAFESTDVCALADSFIVVTEPDYTSFYQDRNLVRRISQAAEEVKAKPLLRSFIVNKSTDLGESNGHLDLRNVEHSFRLELTREFPVSYDDTHPVPVDVEALKAYKVQKIPYLAAPGSMFSFATLSAFADILRIVTSRWTVEQVKQWNELTGSVSAGVEERNKRSREQDEQAAARALELTELRSKMADQASRIAELQKQVEKAETLYEREFQRNTAVLTSTEKPAAKASRAPFYIALAVLIVVLVAGIFLYLRYSEALAEEKVRQYEMQQQLAALQQGAGDRTPPDQGPEKMGKKKKAAGDANPNAGAITGPRAPTGGYAVIISADKDLRAKGKGAPSALYEAERAQAANYEDVAIYHKDGLYQTVIRVPNKNSEQFMTLAKQFPKAYAVPLDGWCEVTHSTTLFTSRRTPVEVLECGGPAATGH